MTKGGCRESTRITDGSGGDSLHNALHESHCASASRRFSVGGSSSLESLATSVLTKLRNSGLNCAPGCESLLAMYSIFGPDNLFEPIPPKVIHAFGLYISIIRPTFPVTGGFQLNIEGCNATIKSTYLALLATKTELFAPRL